MAGTTGSRGRTKGASRSRTEILRQVTTPLGFYVLALLILEATLAIVLTCSRLTEEHVWCGFTWMIVIFVGVVLLVTLFVYWKPQSLLFEKEEYIAPELEPSALRDEIEDLIHANVKPECLQKPQK